MANLVNMIHLVINFIKIYIYILFVFILTCFMKLCNIIKHIVLKIITLIKHYFKAYFKLLVKLICLSVLFYGGIEVTKDYFSYPYVYRLSVKPSERLDLPPITICTERDVLFEKTRIIDYFNISEKYLENIKVARKNTQMLENK